MGVRLHVRSCWASRSEAEAVYELEQTRILVGRGRGADVRLPHRAVSVRHATIELDASDRSGGRYTLTDHETTNGTKVQEARVVPGRKKPLRDGDRIEIGGFSILFRCGVPVTTPTSGERTGSLARRLAREALDRPDASLRPTLTLQNGPREGERFTLPDPPARWVLGRGEDAELVLPDEDASRAHVELEVDLDGVLLRDLGSKNGTSVSGRPVTERRLVDRDEVRVGATVLLFEDPAQATVDALDAGDDASVEAPTLKAITPEPEPEPEPEPKSELEALEIAPPPPPRRAARGVSGADMVIYVLAAAVFAVSLLGLVWLLRAG